MIAAVAALALATGPEVVRPLRELAGTSNAELDRLAVDEEHITTLLEVLRHDHPDLTAAPSTTSPVTIKASASSHGVWRDKVYAASNVLDRDFRTAWVEGKKGHGLGEILTLTLTSTSQSTAQLRGLLVLPGYTKNPGMWRRNGRPREIGAEVSKQRLTLIFDDARRPQIFLLPRPIPLAEVTTITLTIEKVFAGTHYRDTSVAEVRLLFW